jgi:hypothetical protein
VSLSQIAIVCLLRLERFGGGVRLPFSLLVMNAALSQSTRQAGISRLRLHGAEKERVGMTRPRRVVLAAVLSVLVLLLAGCAKKGGGGANSAACQGDQFGCVVYQKGTPIKIATLLAITGDNKNLVSTASTGHSSLPTTWTASSTARTVRSSGTRSSS